jgi:hypothetical protein
VYSDLLEGRPQSRRGVTVTPHKFDGGLGGLDS